LVIVQYDKVDFSQMPATDVIVVGAGAVGIVAALDLARRGMKVVLLEAGPQWVDAQSQSYFDQAACVGRQHLGIHKGRFRALGGTTNFWGGQLVRFDELVFERRPWVGDFDGWPIDFADIERYYEKCEDILRLPKEYCIDDRVFEYAGIPGERADENLDYFLTRWLIEKNFRIRFGRELLEDRNLTLITEAPVVAICADGDGESARGVRIRTKRGVQADLCARHIVLANGTIEAVRLLMHPLANGQKPLWVDNLWLGRGFMDHLEGPIASIKPRDIRQFRRLFDNLYIKGMKVQPRLKMSKGAQLDQKLLSFALHMRFEGSNKEHFENAKIFINGLLRGRFSGSPAQLPAHLWSLTVVGMPMVWHYLLRQRISSPMNGTIKLQMMLEQEQLSESRVGLGSRTDGLGMKIPELRWAVRGEKEIKTIQAAALFAKRYFESRRIADVTVFDEVTQGKKEVLDNFSDTFHHMGAVRSGRSAKEGVVDANLQVFGTSNLFVAGAATFPSAGFANPTFTALALALRLSEFIAARHENQ
jgi:choline dehydrogenase-like flavoprotein